MAERKSRICCVCGQSYKYCNNCDEDANKPLWYFSFCGENCHDIYGILSSYSDGEITDIEAKQKLSKLNLSQKDNFGESYKKVIAKVMKARTQSKKIEIKKEKQLDEVSNEENGIVTETEKTVDSNVE